MSNFTSDLLLISGFDPWSGTLNDIKPLIIFEDNHISTYYGSSCSKKLYTVCLSSSFYILHVAFYSFSPSSSSYLYDFILRFISDVIFLISFIGIPLQSSISSYFFVLYFFYYIMILIFLLFLTLIIFDSFLFHFLSFSFCFIV